MKLIIRGLKNRIIKIYREKIWNNIHYYQIIFGGSSSGKSYSKSQLVVLKCLKGANILVLRKVGATIKRSVFNEIVAKIHDFKLGKYFSINKSDFEITCLLNNKQILFAGADDTEKLKSIRPANGVIDEIWMEEATEFTYNDFKTIKKRLRGISDFHKCITLSFNPILQDHWIFKEFFHIWRDNGEQYFENDKISILKTTYKDNPFLAPEDIEELENESDPYYRDVYTYGNWGVLGETIFRNYECIEFDYTQFDRVKGGIDWGFAKDPFAFNKVYYDRKKSELYIWGEVHEIGITDRSAMEILKDERQTHTTADSSEPKTIDLWNSEGFIIHGAKKGAGSVESGIKFLQSLKIYIHPDSPKTLTEFQTYQWKVDKDGEIRKQPVDKNNHHIDAIRYAVEDEIIDNTPMIYSL